MNETTLHDFFDRLPWPDGKKPVLKIGGDVGNFVVTLHEPISRNWKDLANAHGITREDALRNALEQWLQASRPLTEPMFHDAIKKLWN